MKKFHLITRAVILRENHVLLAHQKEADNTFLPGGHVEIGESAVSALKREIDEELHLEAEVLEYLGAVEAGWEDGLFKHYEINHLFKVNINTTEICNSVSSYEDHLEFFWSPIDELVKNNLLPYPLIPLIRRLAAGDNSVWWESSLTD